MTKLVYQQPNIVEAVYDETLNSIVVEWKNLGPHDHIRPCTTAQLKAIQEGRIGAAGADGVDPQPLAPELDGHTAGQSHQRMLGGTVGGHISLAHQPGGRRYIDDIALALEQVRQRRPAQEKRPVNIHIHHQVPVLVGLVGNGDSATQAGNITQDISPGRHVFP